MFGDVLASLKDNIKPATNLVSSMLSNSNVLSDASQAIQKSIGDSALAGIQKILPVTGNLAVNSAMGQVIDAAARGVLSSTGLFGNIASPHVQRGLNARQDALLNFNWFVEFPTINGINLPWYYCENCTAPWRSIDKKTVKRRGLTYNIAGASTMGELKLDMFLDESGIVWQYFREWEGLILLPSRGVNTQQGRGGRYGNYAKNLKVHVLSNTRAQLLSIIYIGVWPSSLGDLSLQSENLTRLKAEASFSVTDMDYQVTTLTKADGGILDNSAIATVSNMFNRGSALVGQASSFVSGMFA